MDRQTATKLRYDRLKQTLADEKNVRKKARRARAIGLGVVGAWLIVPVLSWKVDLETVARPEFFRTPTPHETYLLDLSRAGAESVPLGRDWEDAAYRAIDFPLWIGAAYQEVGFFPSENPQALGFRVHVPAGQRLRLSVRGEGDDLPRLFLDLYRAAPDSLIRLGPSPEPLPGPRPAFLEGREMEEGTWLFDAPRAGDYVLRLQPELARNGRYRVAVQVGAPWTFPVAGGGEGDIGGVFGDPRDGGERAHHGVDIFLPRGTPVLAAADGPVTSVDTTEIGGRVVWQRETDGGHSIYYAHLDRPLVESGQRLQAGDTVGLVGNTGNARTTPPHLHFGAYRRGPVDPWGLILPIPPRVPEVAAPLDALGGEGLVAGDGTRVRWSPSADGAVLAELRDDTPVRILAAAGEWYRVLLPTGETGYVDARTPVVATLNGTRPSNQQ